MDKKICLFVCDFLSLEVSKVLQAGAYLDVKVIVYNLRVPSFQHNSSWVGNAQQHVSCCNFVLQPAIC